MKYIELDNTKLTFYRSDNLLVAADGIVTINPFKVEVIEEIYRYGTTVPFVARIGLSSGKGYEVVFSSTFARDKFIKNIKEFVSATYDGEEDEKAESE